MKHKFLYFTVLIFIMASCRFEDKIVEETHVDGSPKRVCIYKGKGESRELIKETTYYPNKQAQMEGTYKDGKRDGQWTYWYENGKLWSDGFFVRGKSDGKRTTYFENGKVRYEGFYKEELGNRNEVTYPPFTNLVDIKISATNKSDAAKTATDVTDIMKKTIREHKLKVTLLGPTPATILQINKRYRYHVLLKGQSRASLHKLIKIFNLSYKRNKKSRISIDVDPYSLL